MLRLPLASSSLLALAVTAGTFYAPEAAACGRAMELRTNDETMLLAKAEALLSGDDDSLEDAAYTVDEVFAEGNEVGYKAEWWARRVLAEASIRSHGRINPEPDYFGERVMAEGKKARRNNLERAVATLGRMLKAPQHEGDPSMLATRAEGLAELGQHDDALAILTDLNARDLITDPSTYRTLAELEQARGDVTAADAYRQRCRDMSADGAVCGPVALASTPTQGTL